MGTMGAMARDGGAVVLLAAAPWAGAEGPHAGNLMSYVVPGTTRPLCAPLTDLRPGCPN